MVQSSNDADRRDVKHTPVAADEELEPDSDYEILLSGTVRTGR